MTSNSQIFHKLKLVRACTFINTIRNPHYFYYREGSEYKFVLHNIFLNSYYEKMVICSYYSCLSTEFYNNNQNIIGYQWTNLLKLSAELFIKLLIKSVKKSTNLLNEHLLKHHPNHSKVLFKCRYKVHFSF